MPHGDRNDAMRRMIRGFTLIELLVVLSIISLLLSLSVPRYFQSIERSKEAVLAENLRIARVAIDHFYTDSGRYPQSLEELVTRRYLRALPVDPVTDNSTDWLLVAPPSSITGRVADLHSRSRNPGSNGRPYVQW
jgi:general secretion pathway protein G